jgi:hypothetical protein
LLVSPINNNGLQTTGFVTSLETMLRRMFSGDIRKFIYAAIYLNDTHLAGKHKTGGIFCHFFFARL